MSSDMSNSSGFIFLLLLGTWQVVIAQVSEENESRSSSIADGITSVSHDFLNTIGDVFGVGERAGDTSNVSFAAAGPHPCDRKCDGTARTCSYQFVVERYTVLSAACGNCVNGVRADCFLPQCVLGDGFLRPLQTVNRAFPGTPIVVCQGDTIVVDVKNQMPDLSTTFHWHGITQRGTNHMDGVPMVTQCPIDPFTTFRYRFVASHAGTYFYHSHVGSQKLDGLEGALIVRGVKSQELHGNLYDDDLTEHVIVIQDWLHDTGDVWMPGQHDPPSIQIPNAVLINGRGPLWINGTNSYIPMANFTVVPGRRYRFRLIGATCMTCMYVVKIQSHSLTLITTDGGLNVKPRVVNSISVNSGDRFDFILTANQSAGVYFIFVENQDASCLSFRQVGALIYQGANGQPTLPAPPTGALGVNLNPPFATCNGSVPSQLCVSQLSGDTDAPGARSSNGRYAAIPVVWGHYEYTVPDLYYSGTYQHYEEPVYNELRRYSINNISFAFPPSPLLYQFNDIPQSSFCRPECHGNTVQKSCSCANYYIVQMNTVVDLVITDTETDFNHPVHLHGYEFWVLVQGVFKQPLNATARDIETRQIFENAENDRYPLRSRPMKDSLTIPAGGYAVVRFRADNPGWWFLHCHYIYHLEAGMAFAIRVDPVPSVPFNFPRCGNYYG